MTKLENLLQKSEKLEIQNFEAKNSMTPLFIEVVEFCKVQSELNITQNKGVYEFTPKMLYSIFEQNNSKYFADQLWTHSDNPKNLKANPKNKVFFTSPRRCVYRYIVQKETKEEVESS